MKKFAILTCVLVLLGNLRAQQSYSDQFHNYGDVSFWNNDTAWFELKNTGSGNLVILPTFYNEKYKLLLSDRSVSPGAKVKIGIVYYTEIVGKFNVEVPVYVNQKPDPIVFHLKGNIKALDPLAETRCPNMAEGNSENKMEKVVVVEVRDLETDELLRPDGLSVKSRDNKSVKLEKDNAVFKMRISPGGYKVFATKSGYNEYYAQITLEPYQNKFIVYMEKVMVDPDPVVLPPADTLVYTKEEREPEGYKDTLILEPEPDPHKHPEVDSTIINTRELSTHEYALNNIIFIVDVSSSMNRGGKLESLKSSYNILIDALRSQDRVGIVSMSSNAEIIVPSSGVYNKDSLKNKLATIKISGGTNGGAAIDLAYKLAKSNFIEGGNNQVIIATDGIFYGGTLSRKQIEQLIAKGNSEGIHFSSVAFGSDPKAIMFLENLSTIGGGNFVQVTGNDREEAQLLEMIKTQSKRK
ncbi:MAG: VWA domain-containing protein [Bacteroidetes bacterium]|nr:VWA domain-containing protein [Bacteroidota bacterium]